MNLKNLKIGTVGNKTELSDVKSLAATKAMCKAWFLNCTFVPAETFEYGDVLENGTGTGMIGMIQRGAFDTFEPVLTITYNRTRVIDFSLPVFYENAVLVTRAPKRAPQNILSLRTLSALNWETWSVFVIALVAISVFVTFFARYFLRRFSNYQPKSHWFPAVLSTCSLMITKQHRSGYQYLRFKFVCLLIIFWSFGAMIVDKGYTGILSSEKMSLLALPYRDFESFASCLERGNCRMIRHINGSNVIQSVISPESTIGRRIQAALSERPTIMKPIEEIPAAIFENRDIYVVFLGGMGMYHEHFKADSHCKYFVIPAPYKESQAFAFQKGSPWKDLLDRAAVAFRESGLAKAMEAKYEPQWTICDPSYFIQLSYSSDSAIVYSMLIFLGFGLLAGLVALVIENVIKRKSLMN